MASFKRSSGETALGDHSSVTGSGSITHVEIERRLTELGVVNPDASATPSAPNILSASAVVIYSLHGNGNDFGFQGLITPPANREHLAAVSVQAAPHGTTGWQELQTVVIPSSGTVPYSGGRFAQAAGLWDLRFVAYNEAGAPTPNPYTLSSLTVSAQGVASVSGVDASTLATTHPNYHPRWKDPALHTVVNMTVSMANGQYPQLATLYYDAGDGLGLRWQGWYNIVGDKTVIPIGLKGTNNASTYPPIAADGSWIPAAAPGAVMAGPPNMLLWSGDVTKAPWQMTGGSATANAATAPDGTLTAAQLSFPDSTKSLKQYFNATADPTLYTVAVWVKGTAGQSVDVGLNPGGSAHVVFDGNWQLVTYSRVISGDNCVAWIGWGATSCQVWQPQVNVGSSPGLPTNIVTGAPFTVPMPATPSATWISGADVDELLYFRIPTGFAWCFNNITFDAALDNAEFKNWEIFVQKGSWIGGTWTPAPDTDPEWGVRSFNDGDETTYRRNGVKTSGNFVTITHTWPWTMPLATDPYRSFRIWVTAVSRRNTSTPTTTTAFLGSGPAPDGAEYSADGKYLYLTPDITKAKNIITWDDSMVGDNMGIDPTTGKPNAVSARGPNLFLGGDAESAMAAWTVTGTDPLWTTTTAEHYLRTCAFTIPGGGVATSLTTMYQSVPVKAGRSYRMAYQAKGEAGNHGYAYMQVSWLNAAGAPLTPSSVLDVTSPGTSWAPHEMIVVAPTGAVTADAGVGGLYSSGGGRIYLDDLTLEPLPVTSTTVGVDSSGALGVRNLGLAEFGSGLEPYAIFNGLPSLALPNLPKVIINTGDWKIYRRDETSGTAVWKHTGDPSDIVGGNITATIALLAASLHLTANGAKVDVDNVTDASFGEPAGVKVSDSVNALKRLLMTYSSLVGYNANGYQNFVLGASLVGGVLKILDATGNLKFQVGLNGAVSSQAGYSANGFTGQTVGLNLAGLTTLNFTGGILTGWS